MLSEEQIKQIKEQIIRQIDSWQAPEQQKSQAKQQIESMDSGQLEEFLKQNKLIQKNQEGKSPPLPSEPQTQQCPFCLIVEGKIPAYKIDENKKALAVLEINPVSKGHIIVISKEHENLPSSALTLANKVAKKLKTRLKSEEVKIETSSVLGHQVINVIPIYKNKKLERKKASEDELKKLQIKLGKKTRAKSSAKSKTEASPKRKKNLPQAPKRIP